MFTVTVKDTVYWWQQEYKVYQLLKSKNTDKIRSKYN